MQDLDDFVVSLFGQWIHELLLNDYKVSWSVSIVARSFCPILSIVWVASTVADRAVEPWNERRKVLWVFESLLTVYICTNLMYCWVSYCFISSFRMKLPARFCALKQRTSDPSDLRLLMPIADKSWDWMRWWGRTQWFSHAPHDRFLFFLSSSWHEQMETCASIVLARVF